MGDTAKIAGILVVMAVVAAVAFWAVARNSRGSDGPSPEQIRDIDVLVQRCAHVPQDQMDACTMREYRKLHTDAP